MCACRLALSTSRRAIIYYCVAHIYFPHFCQTQFVRRCCGFAVCRLPLAYSHSKIILMPCVDACLIIIIAFQMHLARIFYVQIKTPAFQYASAFNFCISMFRYEKTTTMSANVNLSGKCIKLRKIYQPKQLWSSVMCYVPMSFESVLFQFCLHFFFAHCHASILLLFVCLSSVEGSSSIVRLKFNRQLDE